MRNALGVVVCGVACLVPLASAGAQQRDSVQALAAVTVAAEATSPALVRVGFAERRRSSGLPAAHFVTRGDIEAKNPSMLREMLDRLGARARGCATGTVFIDGVVTTAGTNESDAAPRRTRSAVTTSSLARADQLDRISPKDVEGMEIYAGSSQIPIGFRTSGREGQPPNCVIVVWLRNS